MQLATIHSIMNIATYSSIYFSICVRVVHKVIDVKGIIEVEGEIVVTSVIEVGGEI